MPRAIVPTFVLLAAFLATQSVVPAVIAAQEATPAATAECVATTPEENEAIVASFYDAIESGDDAALSTLLADDHLYHGPAGEPSEELGSDDTAAWAGERREDIADLTVTPDPIMAEDDEVMAYLTWHGTNAETGETVVLVGVGLFRIECGQIAENWAVTDSLDRLLALGILTEDELQSVTAEATPAP